MLLLWHRRAGKDDICLHWAATQVLQRAGNYWHMLPNYEQARKSVWMAINPHTGKRRIDEAFPLEIRKRTLDQQMLIEFVNGSIWQLVGSDNYNSLVGSPPIGVTASEWALANPSAWAYLSPILRENGGWALFITTPRGKNHVHKMYQGFKEDKNWFCELLSINDTQALTQEQIEEARMEYIITYGSDHGQALFQQEYECSFDAAVLGAYYAAELSKLEREGRLTRVPHDPNAKVYTAWDIGFSDDTAIWWYQVIRGEIHILEYYGINGKDPKHFFEHVMGREILNDNWVLDNKVPIKWGAVIPELLHRTAYNYGTHWLPHDAKAKTFTSFGKSLEEMAWKAFGSGKVRIVPDLSLQDGIQAARNMLNRTWFDKSTETAFEMVKLYQREWDDDKKIFKDKPRHDFTSHAADALRYLAIAVKQDKVEDTRPEKPKYWEQQTVNELFYPNKKTSNNRSRI